MPSEQDLTSALSKADAAGDTAGAQRIAQMIQQQRSAATSAPPTPPAQPQGDDAGALMGAINEGVHTATFGLDRPTESALASIVYNVPYSRARAAIEANANATETAHPYASLAGGAAGLVPGAAIGGAVATVAKALPLIGDAADAIANSGKLTRLGAQLGTDAAVGAGLGYAQGGKPGAVAGAIAGPVGGVVARGAASLLSGPAAAAFKLLAKTVKLPGESIDQAAARLTNDAAEFKQTFGRMPTLAEMSDESQAKEISETVRRTPPAQQAAAAQEEKLAVGRQGEVASAVAGTRPSATAAQGDVVAQARKGLDTAMSNIDQQRVTLLPDQTDFLTQNAPDLRSVMRGSSYNDARSALDDHLEQGVAPTLRDVETWRQAAARGARSADPVVAHNFSGIRDAVRGIGENVPEYADAMNDYSHLMRFGENLPEGAAGLSGATPKDFAAGFNNQPQENGQTATIGRAAQAGQTVGLRTAISQKALQSPNAAAELSRRLTEDQGLKQNIATAMQPDEAASVQRTGQMAYKAARGMAAAVPSQTTETAAHDQASSLATRASLLAVHGGSTSIMSSIVHSLSDKFGLPSGTALKVAQLAMDPKNTPAVLQYLRARGSSAAQRHEFMNLVRSGGAAVSGSAAGQLAAGAYPQ